MKSVLLKFHRLLVVIIIAAQPNLSQLSQVPNESPEPPKNWGEKWHKNRAQHFITEKYTPVYLNQSEYVAIYFDSKLAEVISPKKEPSTTVTVNGNTNLLTAIENPYWLVNFTSNAWAYMKKTYGEFGPNPYLNLVIHRECPFFNPYFEFSITIYEKHNLVHIPFPSFQKSIRKNLLTQDDALDLVTNTLACFVERSSKQRYGSPSHNVWKLPTRFFTAWSDIFTFDVYTNLNLPTHAERYKDKILSSVDFASKVWFRDWFLPIYLHAIRNGGEGQGDGNGNGNAVLNRYFEILTNSDQQSYMPYNNNFELNMNMGRFVHFWSAAADADLKELARKAFGWNDEYEKEYVSAIEHFPYNYTDSFFTDTTTASGSGSGDQGNTTRQDASNNGSENGNYLAAGFAIIVFLILVLIASFIFHKKKLHNLKSEIRALTTEEVQNFFDGDGTVKQDEADEALVLSMPFIKDFEIPRDQMVLDPTKVLGTGQFGTVIHGFLRQSETDPLMSVAMKTVKANVDVACFKAFLSEVKIMAYLGRHENIVDLLGTCTTNIKNREIFIALEFCPRGNLLDYLKNNRTKFQSTGSVTSDQPLEINKAADITGKQNIITNTDLIRWSHQISNAMMYLTEKKVIHGDLAARNILLTEDRTAKISDFGLSRQFLNYANYMKTSQIPVPWRWLAIETLKEMNFSTASDVWAFGVTMWEIFSLGEVPYGAWTYDLFFVDKLVAGDRPLIPTHANQSIYEIMKDCWQMEPAKRPKFQQIHNLLGKMVATPTPTTATTDTDTESESPSIIENANENFLLVFTNEMETGL